MPTATLSRWGNGQGILIPKSLCDEIGAKVGDKFVLTVRGDGFTVNRSEHAFRRTKKMDIADVFGDWDGEYALPEDLNACGNEVDWGKPSGKEMW